MGNVADPLISRSFPIRLVFGCARAYNVPAIAHIDNCRYSRCRAPSEASILPIPPWADAHVGIVTPSPETGHPVSGHGASSPTIAPAGREETYDEQAIGTNLVCRRHDHRGTRKRRNRPARRKARYGELPYLLRSQCAGPVRPRRRHAAFILVPEGTPDV